MSTTDSRSDARACADTDQGGELWTKEFQDEAPFEKGARDEALYKENSIAEDPSDDTPMEEIFKKLESIKSRLQDPELSLEDAFKQYKEGIELIKTGSEKIDLIEKKVRLLGEGEILSEL